jgi:predicted CXXCH cytochrome family protein
VRKLLLLIAAGSLWLFLAAIPALADGGPHQMSRNSGTSTLTSDSCAGCHRAHTAQGPMLIKDPTEQLLCESCHGTAGQGATTNVVDGVQYSLANGTKNILGALRGGGFVNARLATGTPARIFKTGSALNPMAKVSVGASGQTTSAHIKLAGATFTTAPGKVWGNDGLNTGAGPKVTLTCASCHNPHGNNSYRILNPVPAPASVTTGTFTPVAAPGAPVTDAAAPAPGDTRNYTVIQIQGTQGTPSSFLLYTSQLGSYLPTDGDYWHVRVPWSSTGGSADAPNGLPSSFNNQIDAWCSACHTRYHAENGSWLDSSGDSVFAYRHLTGGRTTCTTCHVAHGSNASMAGDGITASSSSYPYPDLSTSSSSRMLKVDNRGTCQLCHDPTGTVLNNAYTGPATPPGVP